MGSWRWAKSSSSSSPNKGHPAGVWGNTPSSAPKISSTFTCSRWSLPLCPTLTQSSAWGTVSKPDCSASSSNSCQYREKLTGRSSKISAMAVQSSPKVSHIRRYWAAAARLWAGWTVSCSSIWMYCWVTCRTCIPSSKSNSPWVISWAEHSPSFRKGSRWSSRNLRISSSRARRAVSSSRCWGFRGPSRP